MMVNNITQIMNLAGKVLNENGDKYIIEIRNKLSVGDTMEILIPGKIEPVKL